MDNGSENKKLEKEQAGQNTAHVALKGAATHFGGPVGNFAYNQLSKTKLGQGLERGAGKTISKTPGFGSANKALNDSGAIDAANKGIDSVGGKNGLNNALNKNAANRKNYLSFLNKKKKEKKQSNENGDNSSEDNSENTNDSSENVSARVKKIKRILLIVKIAIPILAVMLFIFVIVVVIGPVINIFAGISGIASNNSNFLSNNPNEQKYYEKLDKVVSSYQKSCNITIDKNYLHTIIIYPIENFNDFFEQPFSLENINKKDDVDYQSLSEKVDEVAKLLVNNCIIDYEIDGTSYNSIKNSSFFKNYYKELLMRNNADVILEDVFNLAELGSNMFANNWFITDTLKVNLGNCKYDGDNKKYYDQEVNNTVGFSDYIRGVLYGEMGANYIIPENREFLKAFTIVATSYVLSRSQYQSGDAEIFARNGNCWQLSADIHNGSKYYNTGNYNTMYPNNYSTDAEQIGSFKPLSQTKLNLINDVFKEVFGTVMIQTDGKIKQASYRDRIDKEDYFSQQDAVIDAQNGMTYEEILRKYYTGFTLSSAKEDLYADNVEYDNGGYNKKVVFYKQTDYKNKFCGRTDGATISSSGCGVTAMSIVLSTLVDDSLTPPVVMNEAYGFGSCGKNISGTSTSFFKKSAQKHNLNYKTVTKRGNLQSVLNALQSGNSLVIAHMGQGTFTSSGHYIVLSQVNEKGQVYVYDPYHDINIVKRKSGNGWYDFNSVITKQLLGRFYIITKG